MRQNVIIMLLLCIVATAFAQNDEKEILGTYRYVRLPKTPMPKEFKAYKVDVVSQDPYLRDAVFNRINIEGFKKIDKNLSEAGDFTVKVEIYPFEYSGVETYSYQSTVKVDGVEKKITQYGYKGKMRYKMELVLIDKNDSIYLKDEIGSTKEWNNNNYKTLNEASSASSSTVQNMPASIVSDFIAGNNSTINNKFGFVKSQLVPLNYTVKISKKCKFDYSDLTSASEQFKVAFEVVSKNENDIQTYNSAVESAIVKWTKALAESNIEDKKARINKDLTCALYHNLGTAYFLSKDYEKAKENFAKCKEIKSSYGDASEYMRYSTDLFERLMANKQL